MKHLTYLIYELAWALPVIFLQWAVAAREIRRCRRVISLTVFLSTLYLTACDAFALGHGIWRVSAERTLGIGLGPLPVEELLFYLLTSIMAAQGFVMISGYFREKVKAKEDSG